MTTTWEQQGIEKGIEKARREDVIVCATVRFGELSETQLSRIAEWPANELEDLFRQILRAQTAEELDEILKRPDADPSSE